MSSNLKSQSHLRRNKSVPLCFSALAAIVCVSLTRQHRVFLQREREKRVAPLLSPTHVKLRRVYVYFLQLHQTAGSFVFMLSPAWKRVMMPSVKNSAFRDRTNAWVGINGNGEQYRERAGVPILKSFLDCKEFYCFGTKEQVMQQEISASHLVKFLVWISRRETLETTQISIKSEKTCWKKRTSCKLF